MSKQTAPWIVLTTDKPGLDAQSRDAINKWCGVIGKQSYRRHNRRNIQFPSRAVNWTKQQRASSDPVSVASLLNDCEDVEPSIGRPSPPGRTQSNDDSASSVSTIDFSVNVATKSTSRGRKKKVTNANDSASKLRPARKVEDPAISCSPESKAQSPDEVPGSDQVLALLWKDASMGIRVDPFDCVPGTRDDPRQGEILDYCECMHERQLSGSILRHKTDKQILDPGVVATFFVFDMRSTYGSMPLECLMDEQFRPLGLASIAGTMSSVRHAAVNREYVLAQLGNGMRNLRQRLSRPGGNEGDIILISIMFLAATAYVTKDLEGFEVHTKHLKQLVAARGGLDHLGYGGGTKTVLLQWDAAWKLSTGSSLWVDERARNNPVYPPLPLDQLTLALIEHLPIGFRALCRKGLICVELMQILSRMTIAMSYKSSRKIPYDQKIGQYDDYMSVSSLQGLETSDDNKQSSSQKLEALLTLGLILFSSTAFNEMRATPVIFRGPKDALYDRLLSTEADLFDSGDKAQLECYQWIWAVTVDSWRDASRELMPQGIQLMRRYNELYGSKWTNSDNITSMLKRFFWTEDLVKFHQQSLNFHRAGRSER